MGYGDKTDEAEFGLYAKEDYRAKCILNFRTTVFLSAVAR